jgi:integrase
VSPSAYITVRTTKTGRRYVVRYRTAGRNSRLIHAGSFPTRRDAQTRVDLIRGELAAGRDPRTLLESIATPPPAPRLLRADADAYKASRLDLAEGTRRNLDSHLIRINQRFGHLAAAAVTVADIQDWISDLTANLAPASVKQYVTTLRLLLDFAGADPNPARDRRVKLPAGKAAEPTPPDADHFLRILAAVAPKMVLPLITLEQTAMRVSEIQTLEWGDVDETNHRFRLRAARTKSSRPRWVQLPEWLMAEIADTCAREDRVPARRVFPGFTDDAARHAMGRACRTAGIPHYHPHDLRHRRITIWHHGGVPAKQLAERAGHARASMSLDVYSHVMPLAEAPESTLRDMVVRSR